MDEDRVQVTPELIEAGRSIRGGWSRGQLALLGEDWPPRAGWKQRALERTITYADAVVFRQGREAPSAGPGVYADGGCIGRNPSDMGGTWAWLETDTDGATVVREQSGYITPCQSFPAPITNNLTEMSAAVLALESCPDNWAGILYTDSQVTMYRLERRGSDRKPAGMAGVPGNLIARRDRLHERLGNYRVVLLGGHPTRKELQDGRRRDGLPCSPFNVRCDELCRLAGQRYFQNHALDMGAGAGR